jgi:hypothetical protein
MGCGKRIKKELKRWDDDAFQPMKKAMNGEYLIEGLNSIGVISDGGLNEWNRVRKTTEAAAMAIGGVVAAPVTGGASLGMTYGTLSGMGMAAMNGGDYDAIIGAGRQGGKYGAIGGALSMGLTNLAAPHMPANITSGMGKYADIGMNTANNQLTYGVGGYGGARGAGMDSKQAALFGLGSGLGAQFGPTPGLEIGKGAGLSNVLGSTLALGAAAAGGYGMMKLSPPKENDTGSGAGGNYTAPQSGGADPGAGGRGQSKGGKAVPEAEFLDGGSGNWGNAGMGGMFGGLDNLRKKDKFINTDEIKNLYAQRGVGAFVK